MHDLMTKEGFFYCSKINLGKEPYNGSKHYCQCYCDEDITGALITQTDKN